MLRYLDVLLAALVYGALGIGAVLLLVSVWRYKDKD